MKFLPKKWYLPVGISLILNLIVLALAAQALTSPLEKEPAYMEISLDELSLPEENNSFSGEGRQLQEDTSAKTNSSLKPVVLPQNSSNGMSEIKGSSVTNLNLGSGLSSGQTSTSGSIDGKAAGSSYTAPGPTRGPKLLVKELPFYSKEARKKGWQGTVKLQLRISAQGFVEDVRVIVSSGHSQLDKAAVDSARHWQFSPALHEGRPVASWLTIPVTFDLKNN